MNLTTFLKSHWLFLLIISTAAILRLWNLEKLTTFSADQGSDFLIVKRMIVDGKFTLLGPKLGPFSDVGNIYLGPIYYYLILFPLLIFNLDPIGPAIFMVTISLLTIILIYLIGVYFFSKFFANIASIFFAFNADLIEQSRVALNPFPIPFFSAVVWFALFKILVGQSQSLIWPLVSGISMGVLFQLHYLTLAQIILAFAVLTVYKKLKQIIYSLTAFAVLISPQILFEIRHNFFITRQIVNRLKMGNDLSDLQGLKFQIISSLKLLSHSFLKIDNVLFIFCLFTIGLITLHFIQNRKQKKIYFFLAISLLIGIVSASLYQGSLQLHYFAPIYLTIVFMISINLQTAHQLLKSRYAKLALFIIVAVIILTNLKRLDLERDHGYTMPDGWNMRGVKTASSYIAQDVGTDVKFNIAATLDGDTRARPYRYLVEVASLAPQSVEKYPESDVIYLVARDEEEDIKKYTVWEIASFVPFDITRSWHIQNGIKLFKLVKSQSK